MSKGEFEKIRFIWEEPNSTGRVRLVGALGEQRWTRRQPTDLKRYNFRDNPGGACRSGDVAVVCRRFTEAARAYYSSSGAPACCVFCSVIFLRRKKLCLNRTLRARASGTVCWAGMQWFIAGSLRCWIICASKRGAVFMVCGASHHLEAGNDRIYGFFGRNLRFAANGAGDSF